MASTNGEHESKGRSVALHRNCKINKKASSKTNMAMAEREEKEKEKGRSNCERQLNVKLTELRPRARKGFGASIGRESRGSGFEEAEDTGAAMLPVETCGCTLFAHCHVDL